MENYEILGTIGEGTYGIVLKARQKETSAVVALKKFKESDEDEQVRKTALREVRILKVRISLDRSAFHNPLDCGLWSNGQSNSSTTI